MRGGEASQKKSMVFRVFPVPTVRGERFGAWRAEVYRTEPTDRSSPIRPIKPHR